MKVVNNQMIHVHLDKLGKFYMVLEMHQEPLMSSQTTKFCVFLLRFYLAIDGRVKCLQVDDLQPRKGQ